MKSEAPQSEAKPSSARALREAAIADAAYALIETKGFAGASMLAIAKQAKASNETMYRWYGSKPGLFAALVRRNAAEVLAVLDEVSESDAMNALERVAPILLRMLTSDRAIALNRAAAADTTGEIGHMLASEGRETVGPRVAAVIAKAQAAGKIGTGDIRSITTRFLDLLVGDQQIRRVIGALPPPTETEIRQRAHRAIEDLTRLYPLK